MNYEKFLEYYYQKNMKSTAGENMKKLIKEAADECGATEQEIMVKIGNQRRKKEVKELEELGVHCYLLVHKSNSLKVFAGGKGKEFHDSNPSIASQFAEHCGANFKPVVNEKLRSRVRRLFNEKIKEANGEFKTMPYGKLKAEPWHIQVEGMPHGLDVKCPDHYGVSQMKEILDASENIHFKWIDSEPKVACPKPSNSISLPLGVHRKRVQILFD